MYLTVSVFDKKDIIVLTSFAPFGAIIGDNCLCHYRQYPNQLRSINLNHRVYITDLSPAAVNITGGEKVHFQSYAAAR